MARAFERFARTGALSGVFLLVAAAAALTWANSPWHNAYFELWQTPMRVGIDAAMLDLPVLGWINDGLMAAFFLLVGLEIKRELLVGELATPRQAVLPIVAAVGGMVVPALLYLLVVRSGDGPGGWAIPIATDIAFALGVLALLGSRIPSGLKVFVTALAVVDDLGAVLVIALIYSEGLHLLPLAIAGLGIGTLASLNRLHVRGIAPYLLVGVGLWLALHESGLHATLAGIAVAFAIPSRTRLNTSEFSARARGVLDDFDRAETGDLLVITSPGQQEMLLELEQAAEHVQAPLLRLEHALQPLVQYGIMPLFAFANAGVRIVESQSSVVGPITGGVVAGLVLGKPLGIGLASWAAVRSGRASLPAGTTWPMLLGAACLAGIGFTMSLFVASLELGSSTRLEQAKLGILVASTVAGVVGALILRRVSPPGPKVDATLPPSHSSG